MNSHYYQDTPIPRRHSTWDVSLAPKWRNRSQSLGLVNVSGFSPGLSQMSTSKSQRTPATPCFVSPRMAFSTQLSYDSPIQILTSSGSGVLDPRSVSKLQGRCSLRRLSRRWKIVLIMIFTALGTGLFISRKMHEISSMENRQISCEDGGHDCEDDHKHPGLTERFLDAVSLDKVQQHFHTLARGMRRDMLQKEVERSAMMDEDKENKENDKNEVETLEETYLDSGTILENSEGDVDVNEAKELDDEAELEAPDRRPRGIDAQTSHGKEAPETEGGHSIIESEYQEDEETAPSMWRQREAPPAPHQRQREGTYRRNGGPKIIVARNTVQAKPSVWVQRQPQQPTPQNPGQRRSDRLRGQRPHDGRRVAQASRPPRIPPGVNPRRYEM